MYFLDIREGKRAMWRITRQSQSGGLAFTVNCCKDCTHTVGFLAGTINFSWDNYILIDKPKVCWFCGQTVRPVGKREYKAWREYYGE